jgi:predicted permease
MSIQRDIDAELRFHFDARIEELIEQGASPDEARSRAVAEFGDVDGVRDSLREIDSRVARRRNRGELLEGLLQDIRYAARSLRRTPAVSITIILTLALGLGANAAMFSLLDTIFLRPPAGVARPNDVRRVWSERKFSNGTQYSPNYDFAEYNAIAKALEPNVDATSYRVSQIRKLGKGENAPTALVSSASATYFSVLALKPQLGRFYALDEDHVESAAPVAVISDLFWKRQFARNPSAALGSQITIDDHKLTIIGIAPPQFNGTELDATEIWVPIATFFSAPTPGRAFWWQDPNVNGFQLMVRLHAAAREAELIQRTTAALRTFGTRRALDTTTAAEFGSIIAARGPGTLAAAMQVATRLGGVAIIVLVIACANVVNLLLARAVKRRREIAVRLALGVSRARLMRLLITESMLLAVLAGGVAIVAARWGGALLRQLLMPEVHFVETPLEWRVFGFALTVAIAAGVLAGLIPALQSTSPDLTSALKSGARDGISHRSRLRSALVMCQAALSVMLLVGAALFIRSLHNAKAQDIGFTVGRVLYASVRFDTKDSIRDATMFARIRALEPRLAAIPGVEGVGYSSMRPKAGFSSANYYPDVDTTRSKKPIGFYTAVSPGYFSAIGTKLIKGRSFADDPSASLPLAVIVDESMANTLWPGQSPLGHCVRFENPTAPCATVIGVVQTTLFLSLGERPTPHFYLSIDHPPFNEHNEQDIVLRVAPKLLAGVQKSVADLLRSEYVGAIPRVATMTSVMEPEYRPWQLGATLFTLFGGLALLVAGIGIYSTVSYAVTQRTHEFGVRLALGAQAADVVQQVLNEGLRTVAVGVVIGILMTLASGRLVASLLYGVAPTDPAAMILVATILLIIAAAAALVPAWRASRADPVSALRTD